jgi:hypothetical protein
MGSSRIEQDDNRMLTQVVHTGKNFLTCGNLLDRGEVHMAGLWDRSTDVLLLLTLRWSQGSR